tara:strand:+ start:1018 stop:1470 length:453 start_codon:yes stop_codon:yes gene_type:complete
MMFKIFKKPHHDIDQERRKKKKEWAEQITVHNKKRFNNWDEGPIRWFAYYMQDKMLELELKIIEDHSFLDPVSSESEAKKRRAELEQKLDKEWATYSASSSSNAPTEPSPLSLRLCESYSNKSQAPEPLADRLARRASGLPLACCFLPHT